MGSDVIIWDESMSVGARAMDAQHCLILGQINRLAQYSAAGCSRNAMSGILSRLVVYASEHFRAEEALLEKAGLQGSAARREGQVAFRLKMMRFGNAFRAQVGGVDVLLHDYLREWWTEHIMIEDMKYKGMITEGKVECFKELAAVD